MQIKYIRKLNNCIVTRASIGKYSSQQRGDFQKQLTQYDKIRSELQQKQYKQLSLNAMLNDKRLQTSSTSMHYSVWLLLAISGIVVAMTQLSR